MKPRFWSLLFLMASLIVALACGGVVVSCGGGGGGGDDGSGSEPQARLLAGTAAAGAPIIGTVNVRDANGNTAMSAIDINGHYEMDVTSLTPPFLIWVEGMVNNRSVKVYSTSDSFGTVNVTPVTDMLIGMSLGQDPSQYYGQNPDSGTPVHEDLLASEQEIKALLARIFESLGLSGDFSPLYSAFEANGNGFDGIMDIFDFETDPTDNSVTIIDKASGETVYKQNLDTGEVVESKTSDEILDLYEQGKTVLEQISSTMQVFADLYADSKPSLAELRQFIRPIMADDSVWDGEGPDDTLERWAADPCIGPPVGVSLDHLSLYRKMGTLAGLSELGNNHAGYWATLYYSSNGESGSFLISFVQAVEDGPWKLYGNRSVFLSCDLDSRMQMIVNPQGSGFYSGLDVWTNDRGNLALNNLGVTQVKIFHEAFPNGALHLTRKSDIITEYGIDNYPAGQPTLWDSLFLEQDGLAMDKLSDPEFVFVAYDDQGNPRAAWLHLLRAVPEKTSGLTADRFPKVTNPAVGDLRNIDVLSIGDQLSVEWTNPDGFLSGWVGLYFNNQNGNSAYIDVDNPAFCIGGNLADWTSTVIDSTTEGQQVPGPYTYGSLSVTVFTNTQKHFQTEYQFQP